MTCWRWPIVDIFNTVYFFCLFPSVCHQRIDKIFFRRFPHTTLRRSNKKFVWAKSNSGFRFSAGKLQNTPTQRFLEWTSHTRASLGPSIRYNSADRVATFSLIEVIKKFSSPYHMCTTTWSPPSRPVRVSWYIWSYCNFSDKNARRFQDVANAHCFRSWFVDVFFFFS